MSRSVQHQMVLEDRQASGAEEWGCLDCGRRLVLRWFPSYAKVVLARGDERVLHVGGDGAVRIGRLAVTPTS